MSQKKTKRERKKKKVPDQVQNDKKEFLGIRKILKENWKFLVGLCVGVILLYANSLAGDFVSDDYASITQNPGVTNVRVMFSNFNFVSVSTYLIAKIFGIGSPVPYHFFSLILYLLNCLTVFVLVHVLFGEKTAKINAVIFAVLPIHVEAVSWISGKPYLLVSLFVLLSLLFAVLYLNKRNFYYLVLLILSFLCSFMGDRTRALAFVFLLIWYLLSYNQRLEKPVSLFKIFLGGGGVIIIVGAIFWPLIADRISSVNGGYNGNGEMFYNPFFQYPTAVAKYLQLLWFPIDLTLYHTLYNFPVWLNWLIFLSYVFCLIYFLFKNRNLFFALGFIFMATAPSMAPVKVSWLVAERYMFLGSVGFCLFLTLLLCQIKEKSKTFFWLGLFIFVGFYSTRTFLRNINWQTNHNLWVNTCQVSPNSHNAWNNIGDDYDKLGQYEDAIKGFSQSTVVKPNYADAYHNRANIFFKIGRLDLARDSYNTALTIAPGLFQTYISLAQIDLSEGKNQLAVEHAQKLVELQANDPQAHYVFGIVLAKVGLIEEAKNEMKLSLQISPAFKPARDTLTELENIKLIN